VRRYRLTRVAGRALEDIANYIGEQSGDQERGAAYVAKLRAQCEKLATLPGLIGRPRPDLGDQVRSFVFGNYLIVFRYETETIDILNVVHARRDRPATRES
jgi:toxin ParE1/3/4